MRILCTFVGGLGHLAPLLPVARAARDAGHEVAIAGSGGLVPRIEDEGFTAYATSETSHHGAAVSRDPAPLAVMGAEASEVEFAQNFASRGARRMAGAVPPVIEDFGPDLVLRDEPTSARPSPPSWPACRSRPISCSPPACCCVPSSSHRSWTPYAWSTGWTPTPGCVG